MSGEEAPKARSRWPSTTLFCEDCGYPILTLHYGTVKRTLLVCGQCGYERVFFPLPIPILLHGDADNPVEEYDS